MVIDSSALLAILLAEPEEESFLRAILATRTRLVSTVSLLEVLIVARTRKGPQAAAAVAKWVAASGIAVVPFDAAQLELARQAHERFGKRNHPARLNLGDCCAYALAKVSGEPLLFKGEDFHQTDIVAVP
jgi:ribonuclease VapC